MNTVFIPHKFPSLNDYIHAMNGNKFGGNKMKQEETAIVKLYCKNLTIGITPLHIKFDWIEPTSRRDPDNIAAAKKFVLDGMVQAGVMQNDTQQWVRSFEDHIIVDKKAQQGVRITITEAE